MAVLVSDSSGSVFRPAPDLHVPSTRGGLTPFDDPPFSAKALGLGANVLVRRWHQACRGPVQCFFVLETCQNHQHNDLLLVTGCRQCRRNVLTPIYEQVFLTEYLKKAQWFHSAVRHVCLD